MQTRTYSVHIERDEDGIYIVEVPALPGCVTDGRTYDKALANAQEAIQAYLGSLAKHGEEIPVEENYSSGISVSVVMPDASTSWAGSRR